MRLRSMKDPQDSNATLTSRSILGSAPSPEPPEVEVSGLTRPSKDVPDPLFNPPDSSNYNLPPKPLIPLELLATDPMVQRLESISAWSTLLLEEQKASIEFTRQNIQSLAQLLDDDKEMFHLRQFIQKLDNTCFACKELAWNPHISLQRARHVVVQSADFPSFVNQYHLPLSIP
ncbi:hypothetical protein EV360DRAFT_86342 [Lentinula raphanica]|nr:hypothetical protein EV360DRAFT_86342 [Lentinula raphanica]